MFMALAAMFGAQALSGIVSGLGANSKAAAANKAAFLNNQRIMNQSAAQASKSYAEMASAAGQATALQAEAHRQAKMQGAQQATLAAATGTIGASVDAVQSDIMHQEDARNAQIAEDLDTQLQNLRGQANAALTGGTQNLDQGVKGQSMGSILGSSVLNAGLNTGLNYLGARLNFGAMGAASKANPALKNLVK